MANANDLESWGANVKKLRMENENEKMRKEATEIKGNWPSLRVLPSVNTPAIPWYTMAFNWA